MMQTCPNTACLSLNRQINLRVSLSVILRAGIPLVVLLLGAVPSVMRSGNDHPEQKRPCCHAPLRATCVWAGLITDSWVKGTF